MSAVAYKAGDDVYWRNNVCILNGALYCEPDKPSIILFYTTN